ncbi:hypothetical protein [Microcoleus sp. K5-D4]|uniref:hypothetical protein n=1 Tax=Microcoleus sp. K5-D4 TaxID=2818801 RepID=UPI002FD1AAFB
MTDTITRTFPIDLNSSYTPNSIIELAHFRDIDFDPDERVGIYLESWFCNINLKSFQPGFIPEFEGDESEREKMSLFTQAENKSQKLGLRILIRKNNTGTWRKRAEIILVNREREDYFDLVQPYLAKNAVRILEQNDSIAVQLVDYGNGLLKTNDFVGIELGVTITIGKKNNMDIFNARITALELALLATNQGIDQAIIDWVGTAPDNLNTLIELSNALGNDPNFANTVINSLAAKLTASLNLSDLQSRQTALNNLVGAVTKNRFLSGNGTNIELSQINLDSDDVTGVLPVVKGGSGINTAAYNFRASVFANQSIPGGAWTKIILNAEMIDLNNQYNPTNSRLVALTSEVWQICIYITFRLTTNSRVLVSVWKNGGEVGGLSRVIDVVANAGDFSLNQNIPEFSLQANDYLEIYCYCSPGTTVYGEGGASTVFWSGKRIN